MKKVILVRHGEALSTASGSIDYERILSERGKQFVQSQGAKIKSLDLSIDHVISSSSIRTKQTTILLANELSLSKEAMDFEDRIYEAPIHRLLDVFNELPNDKNTILWVGHNPGISHLYAYLTKDFFPFSPGNVGVIELDIDDWQANFEGCGESLTTF